jgi:hypothetical protein
LRKTKTVQGYLRAVLNRTTQEVKYYTTHYEDPCKIVDALGIALNATKNKSVLEILALRERRLDAALVRETNAIANFTNFCIAEKSVLYAQLAAAATALAPPSDVANATTTTANVPSTSIGISDKEIMKKKLFEPRDGWKDHSGKTQRAHYDAMQYHKTVRVFWGRLWTWFTNRATIVPGNLRLLFYSVDLSRSKRWKKNGRHFQSKDC